MLEAVSARGEVRSRSSGGFGRLAVGLMAGTSLDGVDAALVRLSGPPERPKVRLMANTTSPYPTRLRERLLRMAGGEPATAGELSELNFRVGEAFAAAALRVCRRAGISPNRLAVIGSHGQTIFHQGRAAGGARPSTLQIGEPALIAHRTGTPVVADFRAADIAAGGEGAPLVPLVDYLLLRDDRKGTVALNLGGIANVTVIPVRARPQDVFGFDTGPANMLVDALVRHFTDGRRSYDAGGRRAARGSVLEDVLEGALTFPFFKRRPPKSAGREQFGREFVRRYFLGRSAGPGPRFEDLLRTAVELTARSVAGALGRFVFPRLGPGAKLHRLVVSGGGSHNSLLVARLAALLPGLRLQFSDDFGLPVDAKEAIAFAVLSDRTMRGLTGNLPGVTGARRAVVLGKVVAPGGREAGGFRVISGT
ncbi:MAG TPA: anhydro-N-acetylmuramic acid kinase [Terriglobia bacterium]|nr:anhydro-N-acetylmuramic acid kinase [Terriglobia bacterium]